MSPAEHAPLPRALWRPQGFKDHPMKRPDFLRRGLCDNVVDGDTFDCMVEMGMTSYEYVRVRLAGVDTPEIFHPNSKPEALLGLKAKAFAESKLLGKPVALHFKSDDQVQGRFVCGILYWENGVQHDLGVELMKAKLLKSDVVVAD